MDGWSAAGWDGQASASTYATLTALLAGFSISGLFWISSTTRSDRISRSSGVLGIWASLVPLVLATLFFAEIEGELLCQRAVIETAVATFLLIVGAVSLFVSVGHLLHKVFDEGTERFADLVSWVALVLGTAGVYAGNSTLLTLFEGGGWETSRVGIGQAVVLGAVLVIVNRWRLRLDGLGSFVYVVLLSTAGFSLFYFTAFEDPPRWLADAISWGRVIMWSVYLVFAAALVRATNEVEGHNHEA